MCRRAREADPTSNRCSSDIRSPDELVEIRASQRTFEGAYMRTALSQISFALIALKIFAPEFYLIGVFFAVYGSGVLITSFYRRRLINKQLFSKMRNDGLRLSKVMTSGDIVSALFMVSIAAYAVLLVLTLNLGE